MKPFFCFFLLLTSLLPAFSTGLADKWVYPTLPAATAQLPKLNSPLVLDGQLKEWDDAQNYTLNAATDRVLPNPKRPWLGPDDASMVFQCAWTPAGLALSATVTDNDVINTRPDGSLWEQDCIELFVDGRKADRLMSTAYSPGCYHFFVCPPQGGEPARIVANPSSGKADGLQIASATTKTGYVVEVLIPWSIFPNFTAQDGSRIGLQFALDDYDTRDNGMIQPLQMSFRATRDLYMSPQSFIPYQLVDAIHTSQETVLAPPLLIVDVPLLFHEGTPLPIGVEIGREITAKVGAIQYTMIAPSGKLVLDRTSKVRTAKTNASYTRLYPWNGKVTEDGYYMLTVTLRDKSGKSLGYVSRAIFAAPTVLASILSRFEKVDIPALSQQEPYRAAAYLAAGAAVERIKCGLASNSIYSKVGPKDVLRGMCEADARLRVLHGETVPRDEKRLYDLLNLTANPEAQVILEYPEEGGSASVTVYWGSMLLGTANVTQYATPEAAEASIFRRRSSSQQAKDTIGGLPALVRMGSTASSPLAVRAFDPRVQVLQYTPYACSALLSSDLDLATAQSAVILDDCPAPVAEAVQAWAKTNGLPVLGLNEAMAKGSMLVGGDFRQSALGELVKAKRLLEISRTKGYASCLVVNGNRVMYITSPSRPLADKLATLIAAGKPITVADADAMRHALLAVAPQAVQPAALPAGLSLYCADVHMHSTASDGNISPVGLMLHAMYCNMDFAVMTDHNTIKGALQAQRLLARYGFRFPVIAGEEITTSWAHLNAYPLKEAIDADLTPYEITKAAHRQGAVVNWNHPGGGSEWADQLAGGLLSRGGVNAWEHFPAGYERWKAAGILPALVGSTDTHFGTFQYPERTIIVSPVFTGEDLAEIERRGNTVMLDAGRSRILYGQDEITDAIWAALAEGQALKQMHIDHLAAFLKDANLHGLLKEPLTKP